MSAWPRPSHQQPQPHVRTHQQQRSPQEADRALPATGTPGRAAEHLQQPALKANIVLPAAGEAWQCHAARGGPGHLSMAH